MSLIFSRASFDRALSLDEIQTRAPAAFADTQADRLSSRYGQVTTTKAIDILSDFGFLPVQAAQVKARTHSAAQHGSHLLAFAQGGDRQGDGRGEVILYNSHDGTSSLKLFAGFYRFICSNGIVAGDGFASKLRHTSGTVSGFEGMVRDVAGSLPELMDRIAQFRSRTISDNAARDLAENAAALRWEKLADAGYDVETGLPLHGSFYTPRTVDRILSPRRRGDNQADLWSVFNRIQESVMRGGVPVVSVTAAAPYGTTRQAKAISSVKGTVQTNRDLWNLADLVAA
jgi:hypothetical protein